ncbi:MAG: hypothetical protein LBH04_03720 [Tannerellaceae bacterium]|jgi:cysteine synthase|nr:hypothetical protein [Tannerellaceae bacterium]
MIRIAMKIIETVGSTRLLKFRKIENNNRQGMYVIAKYEIYKPENEMEEAKI